MVFCFLLFVFVVINAHRTLPNMHMYHSSKQIHEFSIDLAGRFPEIARVHSFLPQDMKFDKRLQNGDTPQRVEITDFSEPLAENGGEKLRVLYIAGRQSFFLI